MTKIIQEEGFKIMTTFRKGVSGGVIASIALAVLSCFHGLTPEQQQAGFVVSVGVLEALRNIFKKKLPHLFFWL